MESKEVEQAAPTMATLPLQAATQAVQFDPGWYRFSVRQAAPTVATAVQLPFPALMVAAGPDVTPAVVEFVGRPATSAVWLVREGDAVVVRVADPGAALILSSLRTTVDHQPLDINVERLQIAPSAPASAQAGGPVAVGVYRRGQADLEISDADWAGTPGSGLWIEALCIKPQALITAADVEYKALSANGFETPWLSNAAICGTKGLGMPLIGFAVRLRGNAASAFECEYRGYFRSGEVVGPMRSGLPCRSKLAGDPLEAVQVYLVRRNADEARPAPTESPVATKPAAPSFGKFRSPVATKVSTRSATKGRGSKASKTTAKKKAPVAAVDAKSTTAAKVVRRAKPAAATPDVASRDAATSASPSSTTPAATSPSKSKTSRRSSGRSGKS